MPVTSPIKNKVSTCVSIDAEKLKEAKERGMNVSLFLDEALTREFHPDSDKAFNKAVATQKILFDKFIQVTNQQDSFDEFKYGGKHDVVEKKPEQENRQSQRDIAGI